MESKRDHLKTKPANNLVSIVVPAYKEAGNVKRYAKEIIPVLEKLKYDYELIVVEDGAWDKSPNDETWLEMVNLQKNFPKNVTILRHARNYGMTGAMQTGVEASKGDYVLFYSADLEIDPNEILTVVDKLDEGYDFVNTAREKRWNESFLDKAVRSLPSKFANSLITKTLKTHMADNGSGLKGYKRYIIANMNLYGEMQRLMASYTGNLTRNYIEVPVKYMERTFGESAYGGIKGMFKRTFAVILDLTGLKFMATFSTKPLTLMPSRAFGFTGMLILFLGLSDTFYMAVLKIMGQDIGTRPLFIVGLIFIVMGVQMIMFGMLGELMLRTYYESGKTKNFIVADKRERK